jgi:uncharacterized protein YndB with AHSA1/START domain
MTAVPPMRREIVVEAAPDVAFEVFTNEIGQWWPLAGFSVHGDGGTVAFVEGRLIERGAAGGIAQWGEVTRWEPPSHVAFTWHPGGDERRASRVAVTFTPTGAQTLVTLEHSGWEVYDDPAAARAEYDSGWPAVLERYQARAAALQQPR